MSRLWPMLAVWQPRKISCFRCQAHLLPSTVWFPSVAMAATEAWVMVVTEVMAEAAATEVVVEMEAAEVMAEEAATVAVGAMAVTEAVETEAAEVMAEVVVMAEATAVAVVTAAEMEEMVVNRPSSIWP